MRSALLLAVVATGTLTALRAETGKIYRRGERARIVIDSGRPLDTVAETLAKEFGIAISVEDPPYFYSEDLEDVTDEVSRDPDLGRRRRILVPKGGHLEAGFTLGADGAPNDIQQLLNNLVEAANVQLPFGFRIVRDGNLLALVPTRTRDRQGRELPVEALLDRRVSIPFGTRPVRESASLMAKALSAHTGLEVGCCQALVGGIPWGMKEVAFGAENEPARTVLRRLIEASAEGHSTTEYYWLQRCSPSPSMCFINLMHVSQAQ